MDSAIQPGVIARVAGIVRDKLSQWFPPLDPLPQVAPPGTPTRRLDYTTGVNIEIQPHLDRFFQLRALADNYDLMRLVIETFKDHLAKVPWSIRVPVQPGEKAKPATAEQKARIAKFTALFSRPDGEQPWDLWLRALIEDVLVIDAPTIEPIMTRGGELVRLDLVDGATITPKVGYDGRTPLPPDVAYQQIIKGCPTVDFLRDELIYYPRNRRTHKIYGFSPVEQTIILANLGLRREMWLLNFFTDGTVPEAYIPAPEGWTPQQIKEAQDALDGYLAGSLKNRRKVIIGPGRNSGNSIQMLKPDAVGGDGQLDEWMIRLICFAFNISPQALVKMMNRATAKTAKDQAAEEGLLPYLIYIAGLMNMILQKYCKVDDLEFAWQDEKEEDTTEQASIIKMLVPMGVLTVNDARDRLGLDPVPGGDVAMVYTPNGPVPLAMAQQQAQNSLDATAKLVAQPADAGASQTADGEAHQQAAEPPLPKKPAQGQKSGAPAPGSYALAATEAQREAETGLQQLLEKFLAKQRSKLATDTAAWVQNSQKAADENHPPFDQEAWNVLNAKIAAQLQIGFREAAKKALDALQANGDALWNQVQPNAVDWANSRAAELVTQISGTTRDGLRALVARSLEDGLNPQQLKKAIQADGLFSPERASMIARTELAKSHIQGTLTGWKASGLVAGYRWICDTAPCPECQDNAEAGTVEIGEDFPSGDDGPPAHPNCECALSPVLNDEINPSTPGAPGTPNSEEEN
jgi:SPP1 gp7 family putative phage head morphogenesis protein